MPWCNAWVKGRKREEDKEGKEGKEKKDGKVQEGKELKCNSLANLFVHAACYIKRLRFHFALD